MCFIVFLLKIFLKFSYKGRLYKSNISFAKYNLFCPFCGRSNFYFIDYHIRGSFDNKPIGKYYCGTCLNSFDEPILNENPNNIIVCPICKSKNYGFYEDTIKHYFCKDCGFKWRYLD